MLVDTSVLIDYTRGRTTDQIAKFEQLVAQRNVLIGDLILCEFLRGLDTEHEARRVQQAFRRVLFRSHEARRVQQAFAPYPVVQVCGPEIAVEAARNYRHLRALSVTVRKTIDLIVGTYCIHYGFALLHSDRDYDAMEHHLGLKVL